MMLSAALYAASASSAVEKVPKCHRIDAWYFPVPLWIQTPFGRSVLLNVFLWFVDGVTKRKFSGLLSLLSLFIWSISKCLGGISPWWSAQATLCAEYLTPSTLTYTYPLGLLLPATFPAYLVLNRASCLRGLKYKTPVSQHNSIIRDRAVIGGKSFFAGMSGVLECR